MTCRSDMVVGLVSESVSRRTGTMSQSTVVSSMSGAPELQ